MCRRCHIGSAMEPCLRGTVTGGKAAGGHGCSSSHGSARGRLACSPATAQLAPSRGVPSSRDGSAVAQRNMLSGARTRNLGSNRMQSPRHIAPAASAATDAPPVAERLTGADAEQWSAAVEEVRPWLYVSMATTTTCSTGPHASTAADLAHKTASCFAGHLRRVSATEA
jgi:hypothetical protein